MSPSKGEQTRAHILATAEKLFSEHGFDATSIEMIAEQAKVNRALIYYHFDDKRALVTALIDSILRELDQMIRKEKKATAETDAVNYAAKIGRELELMDERRMILNIMLMESLKDQQDSDVLFRCAELIFESSDHHPSELFPTNATDNRAKKKHLIHEFFTGFIPMMAFVVMRKSFCRYFGCDPDEALKLFTEVFCQSHLGQDHSLGHNH